MPKTIHQRMTDAQFRFDALSVIRQKWIKVYDNSLDGSKSKREALAAMDEIGKRMRVIEEELIKLADEWEANNA